MHPTEDRLFHFSVEEFGVSLYGVCDGFGGNGVADFAAKKMPAELLLGQVQFKIALLVISTGFEWKYIGTVGRWISNFFGIQILGIGSIAVWFAIFLLFFDVSS